MDYELCKSCQRYKAYGHKISTCEDCHVQKLYGNTMKITYQKCTRCGLKRMSGPLAPVATECHNCGGELVEIDYVEWLKNETGLIETVADKLRQKHIDPVVNRIVEKAVDGCYSGAVQRHSLLCITNTAEYEKAQAEFETAWPSYCRECGAKGYNWYDYDPSPAGVGLGSGYMTDCDACPACVENDICPRCGQSTLSEEWEYCLECGWNYEKDKDDQGRPNFAPEPWYCNCGQDYTEQRIEEALSMLDKNTEFYDDPDMYIRDDYEYKFGDEE